MKKEFSRTAFRYIFEFVIAGFIGWIYEVLTVWIMWGYFENRGMLHMPIVPIYAVGAFLLLMVLGEKKRNPLYVFLFSAVITTIFELGASYLLEFIFHRQFWTYKAWWGSILDRSSIISSAIFGLFALIYFYIVHPFSEKISNRLPKPVCIGLNIITVTAVLTDLVIS
ncbi:MAG: putative ABC transporter permease, partial [Ruminococcus sp.]|nr:putative ABC transporter permease [Ruminococcus sp.]